MRRTELRWCRLTLKYDAPRRNFLRKSRSCKRLAMKKVKGLSPEEFVTRNDLVVALPDRIQAIPDGCSAPPPSSGGGWAASSSRPQINLDSGNISLIDDDFEQTEESSHFRSEFELRRIKQDQGLEIISEGLETLKNMALDMNQEVDRQLPLVDEIDDQVDKATSDLRYTNVRLKRTITQMKSPRKMCTYIILTCIILGLLAYLYNLVK